MSSPSKKNYQRKGGVKGILNNVKKTARLVGRDIPKVLNPTATMNDVRREQVRECISSLLPYSTDSGDLDLSVVFLDKYQWEM